MYSLAYSTASLCDGTCCRGTNTTARWLLSNTLHQVRLHDLISNGLEGFGLLLSFRRRLCSSSSSSCCFLNSAADHASPPSCYFKLPARQLPGGEHLGRNARTLEDYTLTCHTSDAALLTQLSGMSFARSYKGERAT